MGSTLPTCLLSMTSLRLISIFSLDSQMAQKMAFCSWNLTKHRCLSLISTYILHPLMSRCFLVASCWFQMSFTGCLLKEKLGPVDKKEFELSFIELKERIFRIRNTLASTLHLRLHQTLSSYPSTKHMVLSNCIINQEHMYLHRRRSHSMLRIWTWTFTILSPIIETPLAPKLPQLSVSPGQTPSTYQRII